jgi:radical SAM protein with 4Fe4S-binding SPASM domain
MVRDTRNLASKLTWRRSTNAAKVLASYYWSRLRRKPIPKGLPIAMSVEPTTSCNLRCPQCPSGLRAFSRPTGMLEVEDFKRIIDDTHKHLLYLTFYFQGEPYLHPRFLDMVAYASARNIYTATSTNGHFLTPENARRTVTSGLDRLIVSIDGLTQDSYAAYRVGGQLDKVLDGTRELVRLKKELRSKTPHIILQCIAFNHNAGELARMKDLARSLGVDQLKIKTAQVYDFEHGHDMIPTEGRFARYEHAAGLLRIKNKLLNHCWRLWHACVITWDGSVVPCCFDKDASHSMGSLKKNSLREIWYGQRYDAFRRSLFKGRKEIDICKNCSEGTKVWA